MPPDHIDSNGKLILSTFESAHGLFDIIPELAWQSWEQLTQTSVWLGSLQAKNHIRNLLIWNMPTPPLESSHKSLIFRN
jgi:hypothetical protein